MLPRSPDLFVGREQELGSLLERVQRGGVVLLEGPVGMGKSALALRAAHHIKDRPVRWFSTRHHGREPASLLRHCGSTTGDSIQWIPTLELERACLFIDELDGLEQAARFLEPFLEYLSAAVLIGTCDTRLPLSARQRSRAYVMSLGALNREESARLWHHCTGTEASEDILNRAGGIPLALHTQTLDWLPLTAGLESLSVAPYGLPVAFLGSDLESLEFRFLVERQGAYAHLHPALASWVSTQIDPARRQDLHRQIARALTDDPRAAAFHWVEGACLDEARTIFAEHVNAWQQAGQFEWIVDLTSQILALDGRWAPGYLERGKANSGLGKLELSLADFSSAILWGGELTKLRSLNYRCHLLLDMGRLEEADSEADQAFLLDGPASGRIKTLTGKARVCNLRGRLDRAQGHAQEALDLAVKLGDLKGEAYSRFILGQTRWEQERWQDCLELVLQGLELARQAHEVRLTMLCRFWAGAALLRLGRLHQGGEILEQTWRESRAFSDVKMRTLAELMQAQSLQLQGRVEQALVHLRSAEQHLQRCSYPLLAMHSLILRGTAEGDERWSIQAARLAEQAGVARSTLISPTEKPFRVLRREGCAYLDLVELEGIRAQPFDIRVDLPTATASLPILGKKLLVRMLRAFLAEPDGVFSAELLHTAVWDHAYEGESSAAQVRKNIGALRKLLGADAIQVREHGGGYFLAPHITFCFVENR